ncbi:MAG: hypothetical protein LIO93_07035 [Bacteroidales bacterium]|nr:hypothetical protein [Bacteroidales bacterium]
MYESIYSHYKKRLKQTEDNLSSTKKKIYLTGTVRLIIFIATIVLAFVFKSSGAIATISILITGLILFLLLLIQYNKFQKRKYYSETSLQCDQNELKALEYDFSAFDGAHEKINSNHFFSLDLDLFGKHSLFQSINRTCTNYGKKY